MVSSSCLSCQKNCATCISATICLQCLPGYTLDENQDCSVEEDEDSGFPWWGIVLVIMLIIAVIVAGGNNDIS